MATYHHSGPEEITEAHISVDHLSRTVSAQVLSDEEVEARQIYTLGELAETYLLPRRLDVTPLVFDLDADHQATIAAA